MTASSPRSVDPLMTSGATPTVHSTKHTQCASLWRDRCRPLALSPPRLNRWSGYRRCLQRERVDGVGGGEGCGGERGRRGSVAATVAAAQTVVPAAAAARGQPARPRASYQHRQPWPAAGVRACGPAAPPCRHRAAWVASAIAASVTCGSSKRDGLAAGCSVAGCCVAGCSVAGCCVAGCSVAGCCVAGCSAAGCSVVMNGQCVQGRCESGWAASRTCAPSLSSKSGAKDGVGARAAAMAAYLGRLRAQLLHGCPPSHVCPLGTLELEGVTTAARADLDNHLLGPGWRTEILLHLTPRHRMPRVPAQGATCTFSTEGGNSSQKSRR
eukprot:scaffold45749_cov60-Phaeocystis_antarctica.AAC.1